MFSHAQKGFTTNLVVITRKNENVFDKYNYFFISMSVVRAMEYLQPYKILLEKLRNCLNESIHSIY